MMSGRRVLFEPWGLGDALMAAAVLREHPAGFAIACHPGWIPILGSALEGVSPAALLPVALSYTTRSRSGRLDAGDPGDVVPITDVTEVLSIRGDPRDLRAARRLFPNARVRVSGWLGFVARRNRLADIPYRLGLRRVRNRYKAWADLSGIPYEAIARRYRAAPRNGSGSPQVLLHVGAQWRSRQYPHAAGLKHELESAGTSVAILAGLTDPLPQGVGEHEVQRVMDGALVGALRRAALVVTNDSGPMHLAAFLGCRTLAIARVSNIVEWLPPGADAMGAERAPRGYRPDPGYTSDAILTGWPDPGMVARRVTDMRVKA